MVCSNNTGLILHQNIYFVKQLCLDRQLLQQFFLTCRNIIKETWMKIIEPFKPGLKRKVFFIGHNCIIRNY